MMKINVAGFIMVIILVACSEKKHDPHEKIDESKPDSLVRLTVAQVRSAGIETARPQWQNMHTLLQVNGLVDVPPQNMITVSFPSGGYIKNTNLLPGMRIKKGQVLATMEDQSLIQTQEDYLMASSRVEFLGKDMERQQGLNASKASSDKVLEQATNNYQLELIRRNALKEKLRLIGINPETLNEKSISRTVNIYSPINGYVSAVKMNIGKYVSPTDVLFELVDIGELHLTLTIFEKDLSAIRPGQVVQAWMVNDTARKYSAKVMLVNKKLDSTRSVEVHCHFLQDDPGLLPGMFMTARIETTSKAMLTLPEEALVRSGDGEYVFVQRTTGGYQMVPVRVISSDHGVVGIDAGEKSLEDCLVVVKGAYSVLMKMKNTGEEG